MRQALSDLRVVDVGSGVAAGWCGKASANLGTNVVKVERPEGDRLRSDRGVFAHLNTNRRSVVLEMLPKAAPMKDLLHGVDLIIEAPGLGPLGSLALLAAAGSIPLGAAAEADYAVTRLPRSQVDKPKQEDKR